MSRLSALAISEALSIGQEVIAVHVVFDDEDVEEDVDALERAWIQWNPGARLEILHTEYASVVEPIVSFIEAQREESCQLVVLIPVVHPAEVRYRVLHNHFDLALSAVLRRRDDLVVARVAFRMRKR